MATATVTSPLAVLTTVFTPPSDCSQTYLLTTTTRILSAYPAFAVLTAGDPRTSCDIPQWSSNVAGQGYQYYSPAICPSGFTVGPACLITQGSGVAKTAQRFPAIDTVRGETAAWCVPTGLDCVENTSDFQGGVWGAATGVVEAKKSTVVTVAPAIQIRFVQSDLSLLATHPLTPELAIAASAFTTAGGSASTSAVASVVVSVSIASSEETKTATSIVTDETTSPTSRMLSSVSQQFSSPSILTEASLSVSATSPSASPSSTSSGVGLGNQQATAQPSTTTVAVIVLLSLLISLLGILSYILWRHRRLSAPDWLENDDNSQTGDPEQGSHVQVLSTLIITAQAELAEADSGPPPHGTSRNPAELDGMETAIVAPWSWISRISRSLRDSLSARGSTTPRSSHVSGNMIDVDSTPDSRRTTATSRWTNTSSIEYGGLDVPPSLPTRPSTSLLRSQSSRGTMRSVAVARLSRETFGLRWSLESVDEVTREKKGLVG